MAASKGELKAVRMVGLKVHWKVCSKVGHLVVEKAADLVASWVVLKVALKVVKLVGMMDACSAVRSVVH